MSFGSIDRFWFSRGSNELVCMLRVWFGVWMICKRMGWWGLHRMEDWRFPRWPIVTRPSSFVFDGYSEAAWGFRWLPEPSYAVFTAMEYAIFGLAVLVTIGLFTRVAMPALAALVLYTFVISDAMYVHHNNVFAAVFLVLSFCRCDDHYSVDRWLRGRTWAPPPRLVTPLRLLQVYICVLYFSATFGKLNSGWFDGTLMRLLHDRGHFRGPYAETLYQTFGGDFFGWWTLWAEGILSFAMWIPQIKLLAFWSGVQLHVGIDLMMPVTTFGFQVMSMYLLFIDPVPRRTIVVCPPRSPLRALAALDWLLRLTWVPGDAFEVRTPYGAVLRGFYGVVEVLLHLPLTFPLAFVLGLPFTAWRPKVPTAWQTIPPATSASA